MIKYLCFQEKGCASVPAVMAERMKAVLHGDTMTKCPSNAKIVRIFTSSTFTGG
jgi:hypothetical protein